MKTITLPSGDIAIVDDEDYDRVMKLKWYAKKGSSRKGSERYAFNWKIGVMHRFILNNPKGMQVDHINHNTMDNRKSNLRVCTLKENLFNRKPNPKKKSKFLGVTPSLSKWQCSIGVNYKKIYLGTFETEEDAAKEYDKHAKMYFGQYANLNFKPENIELYGAN